VIKHEFKKSLLISGSFKPFDFFFFEDFLSAGNYETAIFTKHYTFTIYFSNCQSFTTVNKLRKSFFNQL